MGCWNGTCGLTQLPILAGSKILCVLISSSDVHFQTTARAGHHDSSGYCYINGMWSPICLPFIAEYDDYGGAERISISPQSEKLIREFLRGNLIVPKEQDGFYKDVTPELAMTLDFQDIVNDWIERDRLVVKNGHKPNERFNTIGLWMCHFDAFTAMAKAFKPGSFWKEYTPLGYATLPDSIDEWASLTIEGAKKYAEERNTPNSLVTDAPGPVCPLLFDTVLAVGAGAQYKKKEYLRALGHTLLAHGEFSSPNDVGEFTREYLRELAKGTPKGTLATLKNEIMTYFTMNDAMRDARIGWMPQTGKGSQGEDTSVQRGLADFVIRFDKELKRERAKYR